MTAPLITFLNVTKRYSQGSVPVVALRDVSVAIDAGECVAIMGSSGSGKSTFLNLIGCIDIPTDGTVSIEGRLTTNLTDAELTQLRRDKVGMIFQFFNLLGTLTACQNVALPLLLAGCSPKEAWRRADELLALVGLKERATHRPYQLSGGEMQRVAIARALANNPTVLLADEPTGNLDSKNGEIVLNLLRRINQEDRCTIVMVTHSAEAAKIGDRTICLRDGLIEKDF